MEREDKLGRQNQAEQETAESVPEETTAEKTFTQDEVNEIVRKRLARERDSRSQEMGGTGGLARELELREQDVKKREWKIEAKERLARQNLPAEAAELLQYESEQAFLESMEAMQALLGPRMQQAVERIFRESGAVPPQSPKARAPQPDLLKEAFGR